MDIEKVEVLPLEDIENLPTQNQYMTFKTRAMGIDYADDENENIPQIIRRNQIITNNNAQSPPIHEMNEEYIENEDNNQNYQMEEYNNDNINDDNYNDNQINNNMNDNIESYEINENYENENNNLDNHYDEYNINNNNYRFYESKNNKKYKKNDNKIDKNDNYDNQSDFNINDFVNEDGNQKEPNEQKEIKIDSETAKNTKIKEVMIDNRRIEEYDGADSMNNSNRNSNVNSERKINQQIIDNQYLNNYPKIQEVQYQDNNTVPPCNPFYEKKQQNKIYNNTKTININQTQQNQISKPNTKYENNKNLVNQNQHINNSPNNNNGTLKRNNSARVVKEKSNYQLYSSNDCKSGKNAYISKNYTGSEKTTFMEEKVEQINNNKSPIRNNQNNSKTFVISDELKSELTNTKILTPSNTKIINAIPLENYAPNQNILNNNNKIFVATDANNSKLTNILPKQNLEQPQIINQIQNNDKLNNSNLLQNSNQNTEQNTIQKESQEQTINSQYEKQDNFSDNALYQKEGNTNFEQKNNDNVNVLYPKHGYDNSEIQNSSNNINELYQKQGYGNSYAQNNNYNNTNVLYPKIGYGNSNLQNNKYNNTNTIYPPQGFDNPQIIKKRKKKKKIIYVRRNKPIVQQHFDVQIIQNNQENNPQMVSQYQNKPYFEQIQISNLNKINQKPPEPSSEEENKVPPVQRIYQSQSHHNYNYNNLQYNPPQLIKIYPQQEPICNCNQKQYYPIISSNSIPIRAYINEEKNNYKNRIPCTPNQTIISLTPMRTIEEPKSPFLDTFESHYNHNIHNNQIRYFRNQRNMGFRALTPDRIYNNNNNNFERQQIEFDNNSEYYRNNYNNGRRIKNATSSYKNRRVVEPILIYDDDEPINEENLPDNYVRGQRLMGSNY